MTNQNSVLNYVYAMLGTAGVLTVLIMDEEVLVLYIFVGFIGCVYHFTGSLVNDELRSQANKIGEEFDVYINLQKKVLKTLINYHIMQVLVISELQGLLSFSKTQGTNVISAKKKIIRCYVSNTS